MGKLLDLTGKTLGNRTVIKRVPSTGQAHWLVRCKCGRENVVPSQRLRLPGGSSCRKCARHQIDKSDNLQGLIFGCWHVLGRAPTPKEKTAAYWHVRCICGRQSIVTSSDLTSGHSTSCRSCGHTKYRYQIDLTDSNWCWLLGLFHGDGYARVSDAGGFINFAAAPLAHQDIIASILTSVGIHDGMGKIHQGVNVYSIQLAKDFQRFKVSGVGHEKWLFPDMPSDWGAWLAGFLDADGTVGLDGRVIFFQKPHGGMDFVAQALDTLGVRYTRRPHRTRNLEELYVLKEDIGTFKKYVQPKFPKKFGRLFGLQPEGKKE